MESTGVMSSGPEGSNPIIAIEREPADQSVLTPTAVAAEFSLAADDASAASARVTHSIDSNAPPGFLSAGGGSRRPGGSGAHSVVLSEAAYSACAVASSVGAPDEIDSVCAPQEDISDVEDGVSFDIDESTATAHRRSRDRTERAFNKSIERMHLESGNGGPPESFDCNTGGFRGGGGEYRAGRSSDPATGSGTTAFVRRIRARLDAGSSKMPLEMQSSDPIPQDDPSEAPTFADHNVRVWSVRSHSCPILLFSWFDTHDQMNATSTIDALDPQAEIANLPHRKRSHTTHGGPVASGKVGRQVRGPQRRLLMHRIAVHKSGLTKQFSGSDQALRYPSVGEDSVTRTDEEEETRSHRNSVFSIGETAPQASGLVKVNARKLNSIASNSSMPGSGSDQYRSENQLCSEGLVSRASTSGLCAAASSGIAGIGALRGPLGLVAGAEAAVRQDSLPIGVSSGSGSGTGSRVGFAAGIRPGLGPGGIAAYEPIASPVPLRQSRERKWCEEWVQQLRRMHTLPSSDRPPSTSDSTTSDCHTPKNF